jgi:hypothetical protein
MNTGILITILCLLFANDGYSKEELIEIIETYQQLWIAYLDAPFEIDSANNYKVRRDLERYEIQVYNRALPELVNMICREYDEKLVGLYLETLVISKGSADEFPSYCLAEIYICSPDKTVALIEKNDERIHLISWLDWGFQNVTYNRQESISDYEDLKSKLDKLKSKYLLKQNENLHNYIYNYTGSGRL